MYRVLLSIVFPVIVLTGCLTQSLKDVSDTDSVLVIPADIQNTSAEEWTFKLNLLIAKQDQEGNWSDSKTLIHIPEKAYPYFATSKLTPGIYRIEKLVTGTNTGWRFAGGKKDDGTVLNIPFELEQGEITVLDYELNIRQTDQGGFTRNYTNFYPLSEDKVKESTVISSVKADNSSNLNINY